LDSVVCVEGEIVDPRWVHDWAHLWWAFLLSLAGGLVFAAPAAAAMWLMGWL